MRKERINSLIERYKDEAEEKDKVLFIQLKQKKNSPQQKNKRNGIKISVELLLPAKSYQFFLLQFSVLSVDNLVPHAHLYISHILLFVRSNLFHAENIFC